MIRLALIAVIIGFGVWYFYQLDQEEIAKKNKTEQSAKTEQVQVATGDTKSKDEESEVDNTSTNTTLKPSKSVDPRDKDIMIPDTKSQTTSQTQSTNNTTDKSGYHTNVADVMTPPVPQPVVSRPMHDSYMQAYIYEWGIDVKNSTNLKTGRIHIEVKNLGNFSHNFAASNGETFGKILPGETLHVTLHVKAKGELEIFSDKPKDIENGVTETLMIQ